MAQITLNSTGVASSGSLVLQSNGTTSALTIDTSQNAGLGVTPSAWYTTGGARFLQLQNGATFGNYGDKSLILSSNYYKNTSGSDLYFANGYATLYQQASGQHLWLTAASGTAGNAITFTQAMTLDASGNLGIGTTSPSVRLQVQNSAGSNPEIRVLDGTVNSQWYAASDGTCVFGTYSNHPIVWRTNGSERARIDTSGRFLVNTTSSILNSSVAQFVGNSTFANTVAIQANNTNTAVAYSNLSGTATYYAAQFCNNGTSFSTQGNIAVNAASVNYNSTSDYRLKENIAPMVGALAKVAALKPCTYTWKANGSDGEGFIAHELAEVCPPAVTGAKDAVDSDGNPVYQGIDTSFLVATLTAAIQEQQAIITQLQADVAALKGQA